MQSLKVQTKAPLDHKSCELIGYRYVFVGEWVMLAMLMEKNKDIPEICEASD